MICPECGIYIVEDVPCRQCGYQANNVLTEEEKVIVMRKAKSTQTIWVIWLLFLTVFVAINVGNDDPQNGQGLAPLNGSAISKAEAGEKLEFKVLSVKKANNKAIVKGEVVNLDEVAHNFNFAVEFYNKDKKLLTTATGTVSGLQPKQAKAIEASTSDLPEEMKYYRTQVNFFND